LRRVDFEKVFDKPWAHQGIHDRTGRPGFRVGLQTRAPSPIAAPFQFAPSSFAFSGREPARRLLAGAKPSDPPPAAKHLELQAASRVALDASRQARLDASRCNTQKALRNTARDRTEQLLAFHCADHSAEYFASYFQKGAA
jgi:hypothetical protein